MFQPRGRANVPMVVQERTVTTDSDTGEVGESWADLSNVWVSLENRGGAGDAQVSTASPLVSRSTADISARWNDDIGLSGCVHLQAERGCSTKPLTDVAALPVGDDRLKSGRAGPATRA